MDEKTVREALKERRKWRELLDNDAPEEERVAQCHKFHEVVKDWNTADLISACWSLNNNIRPKTIIEILDIVKGVK